MKEYSIGFRMKFDNIEPENIAKSVTIFLARFDRYEIKVTSDIIYSGKIYQLLKISEKLASGRYSLHLPKDVLYNERSYAETKKLIKMLQQYRSMRPVHLVTHIPYGEYLKYLNYILSISEELPKNYILLLENESVDRCNFKYLRQINELCALIHRKKIANVGICLDVGHLLFGACKEKITQKCCLDELKKMLWIISMVKQIHIHDYFCEDHLQLGQGIINLEEISEFIVENELRVPIIIETTVRKPECDGMKQVLLMRQTLGRY